MTCYVRISSLGREKLKKTSLTLAVTITIMHGLLSLQSLNFGGRRQLGVNSSMVLTERLVITVWRDRILSAPDAYRKVMLIWVWGGRVVTSRLRFLTTWSVSITIHRVIIFRLVVSRMIIIISILRPTSTKPQAWKFRLPVSKNNHPTGYHTALNVVRKVNAFHFWRAIVKRWNRNTVSLLSSPPWLQ